MENQGKCSNEEEKIISLFKRNENEKPSEASCLVSTNPLTLNRDNNYLYYNQQKVYYDTDHHYNSMYRPPEHSYYENFSEQYEPVRSRYMDFYYKNLHDKYQMGICDYCSNLIKQNPPNQDPSPHERIVAHKPNLIKPIHSSFASRKCKVKSRYMDYLRPRSQYNTGRGTSPEISDEEDAKDSEENENAYSMTDPDATNLYNDQQDRRLRLYNYIMDQHTPVNQLSKHYKEESLKEKACAKSCYIDVYHKSSDEKKESPGGDSPTRSYGDAEDSNIEHSCCSYEADPEDFSDVQIPSQKFVKRKHNVIKSRYMDWEKEQSTEILRKEPIRTSHLDWKDYHRLYTIHKFLDDMQYNYPSLCTTGVIGTSLENRDLKVLKISNSNFGNASVWIDAGIHAREWIAPAVNTYLINYIVKHFNDLPKSMQNKDWYFLPVMNPDGYEFTHTNFRMWRKNRAWHDKECVGVDLNRNFSFGWGGKGSSDDPKSQFYHGPHPFSEPESKAVRDMLKSSGIKFKVFITLHSFGELIMFPFAFRDELCPDYIRLLEGATIMSKAINAATGNIYKVGISRDVMYGAAGTSCDWSYGEAKIPFCYLIELRSKKHKFRLPQTEIEETGKEILSCITALMYFVDNYDMDGNFIENQKIDKFNNKVKDVGRSASVQCSD